MEYQKIKNVLDSIPDKVPRFVTKKWIQVQSETYSTNKQIRFKTPMLRSGLCNYSDAYYVVKGVVTVEGAEDRNKYSRNLVLKSNAPFISCISNINKTLIDHAEHLDIVMPI